jgi:hypothetical protein
LGGSRGFGGLGGFGGGSWGGPLSSAILYVSIVAIWAGVLMPKWLRPSRSHRNRVEAEQQDSLVTETVAEFAQPAPPAPVPDHRRPSRPPAQPHDEPWTTEDAAVRRAKTLRARRRMLGTLVVLTAGALVISVAHVAAWWVIVPPAVLLGGFLLLLREAARSDAERARRLARAEASRRRAVREFSAAGAPATPARDAHDAAEDSAEPGLVVEAGFSAQIIDISAHVSDQLYDQYTDAAERAVGD